MPKKQKFVTNSDFKDRQRFEVVKRNERPEVVGLKLDDNRQYKFGQGNAFYVDDPSIAHDIHDEFGQGGSNDVLVVPIEKKAERGHKRVFQGIAMPWHKEK